MDEATCFSYVVPKIFASSLIIHINDNKFLIAIIIIVYFLYSFSFKLPLTVFINVHGCLIARLLGFFPSLDLPHFLCLEIPLINMHMHIHILGFSRPYLGTSSGPEVHSFGSSLSMQLELISTLTVTM